MEAAAPTRPPSAFRLRLGVGLILLWWLPVWLLAPLITGLVNRAGLDLAVAVVTGMIVALQTVAGLVGVWLAGAQVMAAVKQTSKKKAIKALWSVLIRGELDAPAGDRPH